MGKKRRSHSSDQKRRDSRRPPATVAGTLASALDAAAACAVNGSAADIPDHLTPFLDHDSLEDADRRQRFQTLLALGYLESGRLAEAESILEQTAADERTSLDFWYLNARVAFAMREYVEVIAATRHYTKLLDSGETGPKSSFAATEDRSAELYNLLGRALSERQRHEEAIEAFRKAIAIDRGSQNPYLNLANLLARQGNRSGAVEVIDRGIAACRQTQELRLLKTALTERPRVSACMIVKNEEDLLPGCLESIRDWVSEIVVVDTGSTDRTVEIAREYGARVFHQAWENDFSRHRNYSIEQATGDWVFIIDADERFVIDDLPLVFDVMTGGEYAQLSVGIYNEYGRDRGKITFANSVRFFRRELGLRYRGIVHNELLLAPGQPVLRTPVRIRHLGYGLSPEQMARKFERTRNLLQRQLEENPDDAFALFNYAQLLSGTPDAGSPETASEIIRVAERVVELTAGEDSGQQHLYIMGLNRLATACLTVKDYVRAGEYCRAALARRPDYLDALINLGFACYGLKDYDASKRQFETYLETQSRFDGGRENSPIILSHPRARALAYTHLGILHQLTDDPEGARRCYLKALHENPAYPETATWLGRLYLSEGDRENAERYFRHQLDHAGPSAEAQLGLASICQDRGDATVARGLYESAAESFPDKPMVFLRYGRFLLTQGQLSEAREAFDRALQLDGGRNQLEVGVAQACFEQARYEAAADYYRRALDLYGPTSELFNDIGNCHFKLEQFADAEACYLRAVECYPVAPPAFRNLGVVQVRLNRPERAVEALGRYLEISPDEPEIRQLVADQYRSLGDPGAAIGHYEKILLDQPGNRVALHGLSESYLVMGQTDAALLGFRRLSQLAPDVELYRNRVQQLTEQVGQV